MFIWFVRLLAYRGESASVIALCNNDQFLVVGGNIRGKLAVCDSNLNKLYDATSAGGHSCTVVSLTPSKRLPYVVVRALNWQDELLWIGHEEAKKIDLPKGDLVCMFDDFDRNETTLYWRTADEQNLSLNMDTLSSKLELKKHDIDFVSRDMQACRIGGQTYAWRSASNEVFLNVTIDEEENEKQVQSKNLRDAFFYGNIEFLAKSGSFVVTQGTENIMQIDSVVEKKTSKESIFPRLNGGFIIMDTSAGVSRIAETLDRGVIVVSNLGDDGHFMVTNLCLSYELLNK
jgi:hypothetical protein